MFQAINMYHDTDHHSSLDNILNIETDPHIPTIIGSNFNTHSRTWSPLGIQPSSWADNLEEWAIGQNLALTSPPGSLTQKGEGNQHDTTIDLVWTNTTAILDNTFQDPIINFSASLGSDHTGLWSTYQHILKTTITPPPNYPVSSLQMRLESNGHSTT
jgi:hypothetical protein